jgi:hypothetical protein
MEQDDKPKNEIEKYIEYYQKDFDDSYDKVREAFISSWDEVCPGDPSKYFPALGDPIWALRMPSRIESKIREVEKAWARSCEQYATFRGSNVSRQQPAMSKAKPESEENLVELISSFEQQINRPPKIGSGCEEVEAEIGKITGLARQCHQDALKKADSCFRRLNKCPFGEQENNQRNARTFQQEVMSFIDWLFIGELERMDLCEIEDSSQKRDGGYKVTDQFNTKERCMKEFSHLFVECKNYKKPSYHDLLQVLSYTLHCVERSYFKIPVCILVSRINPLPKSATSDFRRTILNRPIEKEERLILFLDVKQLKEMLDRKRAGMDPASLIKDKIYKLALSGIKERQGAY